jgi:hypothetical protein
MESPLEQAVKAVLVDKAEMNIKALVVVVMVE